MTQARQDEHYMREAVDLARRGMGQVEPNPMVGALIVCDGQEVARGWHKKFGEPHAEVMALQAARLAGADVTGCTMYVTLEPCSHFGKTPPCADALIEAGLSRVVVGLEDPDEKVAGRGLARLREAGIEVVTGICADETRHLLRAYLKLRTEARPWVICKWAQTTDGCICLPREQGRWVSGAESRMRVHELRAIVDGICVGINTVLADDPMLTNRSAGGKQPTRLVLDTHLRIPVDCQLVESLHLSAVIIATSTDALNERAEKVKLLENRGVEMLPLPLQAGRLDLGALIDELGRRQWTRLLIEGGAQVHRSILQAGLADELQVFISPHRVASPARDTLPRLDIAELRRRYDLPEGEIESFGPDRLETIRIHQPK
jgi:diaminohydroxyphosphoribosylaminopyrimidine deaminase/5-amino-6-(5-phosphoribosylamino)uracil reductase